MMVKLNELWLKETQGKMVDCGKSFLKPKKKKKPFPDSYK